MRPNMVLGIGWMLLAAIALEAEERTHPLDPLTAEDYRTVTATLEAAQLADRASRYPLITLFSPSKPEAARAPAGRQAFVIVKNGPRTFEGVVDLARKRVASWREVQGVQAGILLEEWTAAQDLARADTAWRAAMRKRGIDAFDKVICVPLTVGSYGDKTDAAARIVHVASFDGRAARNYWGRPIEGVIAVVDLDQRRVREVVDTGVVPVPDSPVDLPHAANRAASAARRAPAASGLRVEGQQVSWHNWRFRFRVDPRVGLVVSNVDFHDRGRRRSVLYEGSVSELFVPYMDPGLGWYFRTYMDAGEYGVGKLVAPLLPGSDAAPNAVYFDAVFADDKGVPYKQPRAACLFERRAGEIAWRHYESVSSEGESRGTTQLVLRSISAIGNYDYIFDWVFCRDGTIRVAVGTSGIEQVKGVTSRSLSDPASAADTRYGRLVAPHTVAVHHDHFFSFRLDLDVDGRENSFVLDELVPGAPEGTSPRTSLWSVKTRAAASESDAKRQIMMEHPALWRVINPTVKGPLGYPVGYELAYGHNAVSLLAASDPPQRRAAFTDYHLWVTPFAPDERYAGGTYPNQSRGGDGLPRWTSANRRIENTDIVLWYTLGFHHVVRSEDWPVLPTTWHFFELRPFDFFDRNPALDIEPEP